MFYLFLGFGLLIRFFLVHQEGFKADIAFWKSWGLAMADKGLLWLVNNTNYNYPPGFAYVLGFVNKVYGLFKDAHNINEYWLDGNVFYLFVFKLLVIGADLFIVWLIIRIGRVILNSKSEYRNSQQIQDPNDQNTKQNSLENLNLKKTNIVSDFVLRAPNFIKVLALLYFLNPAVIYDGVVWGQVDQFGVALFLLSAYFLLKSRSSLASIVFTVSCLMKFQNIIFIPLFFLFVFKRQENLQAGLKAMSKSLMIAFLTFFIICLPFFYARQMEKLVWLLTINSDWFPWFSLNAFNPWWIVSGLNGMGLVDKHLVLGILSAKQTGFFLFIFAYAISTVALLFSKRENLFRNFVVACILATFSFFHLLTQSHERYLFPIMGLLPILIVIQFKEYYSKIDGSISKFQFPSSMQIPNSKFQYLNFLKLERWNLKVVWLLEIGYWLLLSVFFFLNMYLSMGWNYPDQVIPAFTRDQTLGLSLWISISQIILFTIFVVWSIRLIRMTKLVSLIALVIIGVVFLRNLPYVQGRPISLTSFKPVSFRQDYLDPQYNRTVESARGVNYWNRLSVNYYFYDRGIGSHADSDITYHLNQAFSVFRTDYGVDTEADQSAKVYFEILADGKVLFRSNTRGRFDPPGSVTVNVKGAKYLTLRIVKAGENNFGAHVDWLNPVLHK